MKKQLQILAVTLISIVVISSGRQEIEMPGTAQINSDEIGIQEWANEVYKAGETANWDSESIITVPIGLNGHHFKVSYYGEEIRIYKDGLYLNSIY